jgi:hypothetical protein
MHRRLRARGAIGAILNRLSRPRQNRNENNSAHSFGLLGRLTVRAANFLRSISVFDNVADL